MALRWILFTWAFAICSFNQANGQKMWSFLVAASNGYSNYRHQADVCHAYQILHENGIPDENIIVMMADDVAYSPDNPTPGIIVNVPGGKDVYKGVPKDYTNETVTPENFLNILSGNKKAMRGIGSGRVIQSGPNDYIFVNFVDHGGPGVLCFGEDGLLAADDLVATLKMMAHRNQFKKMFLYIEACHSGSMFDSLLPDDLNIAVMTAADPHENSYACYFDEKRETYLADLFSAMWMHDTEQGILPAESMHHQFQRVRTWTNESHVEEYGDLDIGLSKLSSYLGFRETTNSAVDKRPPYITDLVSNADVPLHILDKKMENAKSETVRRRLKEEKLALMKLRWTVDKAMAKIESIVYGIEREPDWASPAPRRGSMLGGSGSILDSPDTQKIGKHIDRNSRLHHGNFPCYKALLKKFSNRCFNVSKHPYALRQLSKLIPMCSTEDLNNRALDAISSVCTHRINYPTSIL